MSTSHSGPIVLTIDTCVWLNLTVEFDEDVLTSILQLLDSGKAQLLQPSVVLEELRRNRTARAAEFASRVKGCVKPIKELLKRYAVLDDNEKVTAEKLLDKVIDSKPQVEQLVQKRLDLIEKILLHNNCKVVSPDDELRAKVFERALAKKAPFQTKNSVADAMIFEVFERHCNANPKVLHYFISANKSDFSDQKDQRSPHRDIAKLFSQQGVEFSINIAETLNAILPNIVKQETVREVDSWTWGAPSIYHCPKCGSQDAGASAHPSQFGWMYFAICSKCGYRWNTGEFLDD